jgi:hypothetical protein
MLLNTIHPGKLATYVTLSFADLYLTYSLIQNSHGAVYEGNPIANAWLTAYGWKGLAAFKISAMVLVAAVAVYVSAHRPQMAGRLLGFACCAVGFVVVYSCWLANSADVERVADEPAYELVDRVFVVSNNVIRPAQARAEAHLQFRMVSRPRMVP